tara:strand:- start:527 stop:1873 length:1347 start_codon:yes stop_codon:yes gene_type:complete
MKTNSQHTYFFIGIGGVGMSALARLCYNLRHVVYGYDRYPSDITKALITEGIKVIYDDSLDALPDFLFKKHVRVIYSSAIALSHPQLMFYIKQGNIVMKRSKFLALLCKNKTTLAVAGTHGKTTTCLILTHIFLKTKRSFTSLIGGFLENNPSNLIKTGLDTFIVEADEYDRSFLQLYPTFACITSIDPDHLDVYKTKKEFINAFIKFSNQVDNELVFSHGLPFNGITFGIDVSADYRATNLKKVKYGYRFDLNTPDDKFNDVCLNLIGRHNVMNTIAAIAMAEQAGINASDFISTLENFPGVYRRMNIYQLNDSIIIDDYAHHPSEIQSIYNTIRNFYPSYKNCVVFQPHLYSRTRDFMKEFSLVLSMFDEVILLDIYPAREKPIEGINSKILLDNISQTKKRLIEKTKINSVIQESEPKIFAILGAGDIGNEVKKLNLEKLKIEKE